MVMPAVLQQSCRCRGRLDNVIIIFCVHSWHDCVRLLVIIVSPQSVVTRVEARCQLLSVLCCCFFSGQMEFWNFRSDILKVVVLPASFFPVHFGSAAVSVLLSTGRLRGGAHVKAGLAMPLLINKGKKLLYIRRSCLGGDLFECLGLTAVNAPPCEHDYAAALRKPQTHSDMG